MPETMTRKERLAGAREWAGFRSAHFARETGTLVVVVSADDFGLDPGIDGETKWYTICDDHDQCVGHETLATAKYHSSNPIGWCEVCNGTDPGDHLATVTLDDGTETLDPGALNDPPPVPKPRYAVQVDCPRAEEQGRYPTLWLLSTRHGRLTTEQHKAQTWAKRESAEPYAEKMQRHADASDGGRAGGRIGDTVVTVVEVVDPLYAAGYDDFNTPGRNPRYYTGDPAAQRYFAGWNAAEARGAVVS